MEQCYYLPKSTFTNYYFQRHPPDLQVKVADEIIEVHKILLLFYSPVFETQLLNCKQDDILEIKHCDNPKIFRLMIDILSYKRTKQEICKEMGFDELIEVINLANYYNIDVLLDVLQKRFDEYQLYTHSAYRTWKKVEHKHIKKKCMGIIFESIKCYARRQILANIITSDDIEQLFLENKKLDANEQISQELRNAVLYEWQSKHIIIDNIEHNIKIEQIVKHLGKY